MWTLFWGSFCLSWAVQCLGLSPMDLLVFRISIFLCLQTRDDCVWRYRADHYWWLLPSSLLQSMVRPIIRPDGSIYRGGGMLGGDAVRLERKVIPVIAPPTGSGHCTFTSWPGKSAIYFPISAYCTLHTTFIVIKGIWPTNQVQCANSLLEWIKELVKFGNKCLQTWTILLLYRL